MNGPYFETWSHENLVKFAKEAYAKLQRQEEELQRLRCKTRPATREEKIVRPGVYEVPAPPRREWVGLTDTDIEEVWADENLGRYATSYAIEAKLKEKNA